MTMLSVWRRAGAATLAAGLAALLLSACVISSTAPLVPASEAAAVLAAGFPFVTYDGTGPYAPSEEQGFAFTKAADSNVYADPTGAMKVAFVPRQDGTHLIAIESANESGEVGYLYGLATVRDGIMAIEIVLAADPAEDLAAAGVAVPAGVTIDDSAISVTDRAGLDAVIELVANGTIWAEPLLAWVGADEPPATIVRDGDWYRGE